MNHQPLSSSSLLICCRVYICVHEQLFANAPAYVRGKKAIAAAEKRKANARREHARAMKRPPTVAMAEQVLGASPLRSSAPVKSKVPNGIAGGGGNDGVGEAVVSNEVEEVPQVRGSRPAMAGRPANASDAPRTRLADNKRCVIEDGVDGEGCRGNGNGAYRREHDAVCLTPAHSVDVNADLRVRSSVNFPASPGDADDVQFVSAKLKAWSPAQPGAAAIVTPPSTHRSPAAAAAAVAYTPSAMTDTGVSASFKSVTPLASRSPLRHGKVDAQDDHGGAAASIACRPLAMNVSPPFPPAAPAAAEGNASSQRPPCTALRDHRARDGLYGKSDDSGETGGGGRSNWRSGDETVLEGAGRENPGVLVWGANSAASERDRNGLRSTNTDMEEEEDHSKGNGSERNIDVIDLSGPDAPRSSSMREGAK